MTTTTPRKIQLGDLARDRITGYEGIVIARTEWLNQCDRYTLQPRKLHDGKPIDSITFDEGDLELVEDQPLAPKPNRSNGGPRPEPSRRTVPS